MKGTLAIAIIFMLCLSMFSTLLPISKAQGAAPVISSVSTITATNLQTIYIYGSGFGNTQPQTVSVGDGSVDTVTSSTTPSMAIYDNGGGSHDWSAGRIVPGINYDAIGIFLVSWSDNEIVLGGFGTALGTNGQGTWNIAPGDPLTVNVTTPSGDSIYSTTVAVNAAPTVSVSPSSLTMDVGQSTTFTATASGGSGTYSYYLWYVNGLLAEKQTQSGATSVMPFTPGYLSSPLGTYSITVTVTDSLGVTSALSSAATVTVSAVPTVSIAPVGPVTLGAGQSQTFTASASGGTGTLTYQWYLNGLPVGSDFNTYIFSGSVGSYSVTCTVTDSASTPVASAVSNAVSVTVNQLSPTYTVTFSESGLASGVQWSVTFNGTPFSATSSSIAITGVSNGPYSWSLSPPNGYTTSQTSGLLTVNGANVDQPLTFQKQTSKTTSITSVTCSPNSATVSSPVTCTATVTGANPTGTITWSSSSSTGSFKTSSSPLVSGSCSVTYTDTSSGIVTITATYSGDTNNAPSSGSTTLTVVTSSQPSYITVESEYTGYFLENLPLENTFGVYTSLSGTSPVQVYGILDGTNYSFSNPTTPNGPYTLNINMGSLTPGSNLEVYAVYFSGVGQNPGAAVLGANYPIQIIATPSWLISIITQSDSITINTETTAAWNNAYSISIEKNWDLSDDFEINIPLPAFAGGGSFALLPAVEIDFSFYSNGVLDLSSTLNLETPDMSFGPATVAASVTISASGEFALESNSITWLSATLSLNVDASASQDIPIVGYTFNVPGYGDVTIGFTATVSVDANFAVNMILAPTQDASQELISGVEVEIQSMAGQISFNLGLAFNAGVGVASLTGGGSIDFTANLEPTQPYISSGTITGTVSISCEILEWDETIWNMSGTLYQWPSDPSGAVDPSNSTVISRYYDTSDYESVVWVNGSSAGTAMQDIYPYTRISASSNGDTAYIFYTSDNVSASQQNGLYITGFAFNSSQNSLQDIALPSIANEILFDPVVISLPNGTLLAMWDSIPFSEMDNAASPFDINQTIPQYSLYNANTDSWGPITSLTIDGVATSYALSSDSTGCYALVLEGDSLFASNQSLVEYDLQTGSELLAVNVANVSNIVSFNSFSNIVVLQQIDGSYQLLNLSSLVYVELPSMTGYTITNVQFAVNSTDTLGILYANSASTIFSIFNVSSNIIEFTMNVSQSTSYLNLIQLASGYELVTSDSSGIIIYIIENQSVERSIFYPMENITFLGATVTDQGVLVYTTVNYGNSSYPLLNLALTFVPTQYEVTFNAVGVGADFNGTVVTIDGTNYSLSELPVTFWWDVGSVHTFSYSSQLGVNSGEQYVWDSTSNLSTLESSTLTITGAGNVTGNYGTQYLLTVTSAYGSPSGQGWYNAGATANAGLASGTVSGGVGTQYVFTGWSGDASGSGFSSSNAITMSGPETATANWQTQYQVTFAVSGDGSTNPTGSNVWENAGSLSITATPGSGYTFSSWSSDTGSITFSDANSASTTATINGPGTITGNFSPTSTSSTSTSTSSTSSTSTSTPKATPTPTSPSSTPTASPPSSPTPTGSTSLTVPEFPAQLIIITLVVSMIIVLSAVIIARKRRT